jgi:soluble lytic murein transglycosylase
MARAYVRLAVAAEGRTDRRSAREAYAKVYYDFPLSDVAADAQAGLTRLGWSSSQAEFTSEMRRAQTLFDGRRFAEARKAFAAIRGRTAGDERSLVDLRMAQCDVRLARHTQARDTLRLLLNRTWARRAEVEFAYLSALNGLRRDAEYLARVTAFVKANPANPLAEQALDDLGTYYILKDEDAKAAKVFAELYDRNPLGSYAERAAWKAGWWAYRERDYAATVRLFESAAAGLTRADNRPAWLYWAARAHQQRGEAEAALAGYRQTIAAYGNSYYGREAGRRLAEVSAAGSARPVRATATRPAPLTLVPGTPPANTRLIQDLLSAALYDDAILEIRRIQRQQGTSPMLDATLAYALNRKGQLRPAINAMRRAYPQFLAEGGEALPEPILKVIFPIEHWNLLRKYAATHDLDPYLLAAQVAQESTFQADVRSPANAYGLMQILPSTGRRFARQMGIPGFSTASLTDPEINVRIGTRYLSDLIDMLGGVAPALAAYNAGEHRVVRWQAERPGLSRDEFVDDIPFPETQFYVKRILGTAEDYRRLYGEGPRQVAHAR